QPLISPCRAFNQLPLITEEHIKIAVVPFCRIRFPCTLNTAAYGINTLAAFKRAFPAESHLLKGGSLRFRPHMGGVPCAVAFAEGVSACNKCYGLLIIHPHAGKGFTHINP